jgi:hypothetical protein
MLSFSTINWPNFVVSIFGGVAGSLAVVFGLSRWLGEVWKAKILESLSQLFRAETKFIHNVFFIAQQLAGCAVLHGEHIPSCAVRHSTFGGFY